VFLRDRPRGRARRCAIGAGGSIAACRKAEDVAARQAEGFDSVRIDHGDAASVERGWREAMEIDGRALDALFNNGGHGMSGAAEDVPREALELVFASNVFGVHQLTRLALPGMIAQGHGRIVMHSSVVGYTPLRWRAAYVATKHAIEGLTNTMRIELRGTGVHVSILNTGPVASGFRENSTKLFDRWIDVGCLAPRDLSTGRVHGRRAQRCTRLRSKEPPRTSSRNSFTPSKRRVRARGTSLHPMPMSPPS
jgi:NAD(P)-dependent dehydrogenase (short-subunit alcohol dehydrogenase family)